MRVRILGSSWLVIALLCCVVGEAADWGLKEGTPGLKSAGPLAFGPDGILLVGDTKAATVFAIATDDTKGDPSKVQLNIKGINQKIAGLLKVGAQEVSVNDLAVNPLSGNVYLSITDGTDHINPALLRVDATGKLTEVSLKKVNFSKVALPNPPEDKVVGQGRRQRNNRDYSITDLAFTDGKVLVSGLTNEKASSTVREIPFPFVGAETGVSIEIYHGAHGKFENYAPVRTFVPFVINGEPNLLAGFQCTPLVKFPVNGLRSGKSLRGTTVAELGNQNRPLDMIVYKKGGEHFLLMANDRRGVMKISTKDIGRKEGISKRISGTAGQTYETIKDLQGVVQLDRLDDENAVVIVNAEGGSLDLRTVPLP